MPEFLQFKWRKKEKWNFRVFFPKWKVPGAQIDQLPKQAVALSEDREKMRTRMEIRGEEHPQVLPCCLCAASALASQSCRLPSSQLVFGVLDDQQDQSLRSWDDYTFLLGGQLESNAGGGLKPLKIST